MIVLPNKQYPVVLADFPHPHYGDPNKDQAAGKHYKQMSLEEINAFPMADLLLPKSVCLLWTTSNHFGNSIKALEHWGLHYRGVAFVWEKTNQKGEIIQGQGVRPSFVKSLAEFVIWGSFQAKGRPIPIKNESVGQTILAPRGKHSEKPEECQNRIERLVDGPFLELFARRHRGGDWTCWGDQLK